jgi:para-nitrobenzyl esterase
MSGAGPEFCVISRPWMPYVRTSKCAALAAFALLLCGASACGDDSKSPESATEVNAAGSGSAAAQSGATGVPRVTLDDGALDGLWIAGGLRAFLGIPFAKPPVETLRWLPPEKNEAWSGLRDASKFRSRCPQPPSTDRLNVESEDCLYLNVWAPTDAKKLPVMVWIHGGGNVNGSASEWVYDGQHLASHGVVLVSINYRLGVFGFFAHEALSNGGASSGNQGLWDQQRALSWVHDNIEKFGGDPANVTIFGESAGSTDVCMHMASPKSRGLFARAISQSGGCTTLRSTLVGAQRTAARFAEQLGCSGADPLECMRQKPFVELVDSAAAFNSSFNVVVDGMFMPEQPRALFDRGEIAEVPYMLGSTTDEGSYWTLDATDITNDVQYLDALRQRFPEPVEPILQLYPASKFAESKNPYQAALTRVWGDARLVCPTYDVATRALARDLPVFMYNWDIPVDDVIGVAHASELVFVFGTSLAFTPETMQVSERMQRYWTNFAKTGDPNGGDSLAWPKLTSGADVRINFGIDFTIVPDFRGPECAFWQSRFDAAFNAP